MIKMRYFFLVLGFHALAQQQVFDNIKNNPKAYTETYYKVKNNNNELIKGELSSTMTYVKDTNNVFVAQSLFTPEKWELPETKYSNTHQKLELINYYDDGQVINRTKYKYDNKGYLVEEAFYYASDTLINKIKHEYADGLKVKSISFVVENGILTSNIDSKTTFEYDKNQNLIREIFSSAAQNDTLLYVYNDRKFLIEHYHKLDLYHNSNQPLLYSRFTYKSFDKFNWTSLFYEEGLDSKESYKAYFVERTYTY
jgi:hypothetical protein